MASERLVIAVTLREYLGSPSAAVCRDNDNYEAFGRVTSSEMHNRLWGAGVFIVAAACRVSF